MRMARTKRTTQAKGSSASPPSKKAKTSKQSPDPKSKTKQQKSEPAPKAKGIVIKEPTMSKPISKPTVSGKGKEKEREADTQARVFMTKLDTAYQRYSRSQSVSASGGSSASTTPSETVREAQHMKPPPNFNNEELTVEKATEFKKEYGNRSFCPIVSVDFEKVLKDCHIDLTPYLGQFSPLLKLRTVYSPLVVKIFYFHMEIKDLYDKKGNIVEEVLETTVRGKKIRLTADLINTFLGVERAPDGPFRAFTDEEIFSILRPGEEMGPLNFPPSAMKDEFRVVWYIYSRCLVNKGKNFSHFTTRDYPLMASIISQEPRNIGAWILNEMRQFRFHSSTSTTIPYPPLISYILFLHNIWYLAIGEKPVGIERFGKVHLSRMKISFQEGSVQSKSSKPKPKKPSPSPSRADEAQSSQAGSPGSPGPSFFKASIQVQLQEVLEPALQSANESLLQKMDLSQELFFERIHKFNEELIHKFDSQVKKLVDGMNENFRTLTETLQFQTLRLDQLETSVRSHLGTATAGPSFPEPPPPPSSAPYSSEPVTPIPSVVVESDPSSAHPEPTLSPINLSTSSSDTTSSPSFDPMTALVVYTPPPSSSSSFTFPTLFPDDKGGEE